MVKIKDKPVIVKINFGEITNSASELKNKNISVDLFNGTQDSFNNYKLMWDETSKKFTIGAFYPNDGTFDIRNCSYNGSIYLNGERAEKLLGYSLIVGTHIGEQTPTEDLISKQHIIKTPNGNINTKFDFTYVQMTTGVSDGFGEEKYRKTSENSLVTAGGAKDICKGKTRLGFSHYLTGNPESDPENIGRDQAKKFLKAIVGSENEVKDPSALIGGMIPMVVFMDNITQVGFYGASPIGVKKDLENF